MSSAVVETSEERIVDVTQRVIEEAMATGPAVFVGRGAQCLLAERTDALHVFCYAPRAALVAIRDRAKFGVKPAEAERVVAETEPAARAVRQAPLEAELARVTRIIISA